MAVSMSGPEIRHFLVLGAGFTRNWGGWLASDLFSKVLSDAQLDPSIRELLWTYRDHGGVERVLGDLQDEHARNPNASTRGRLAQLEDALYRAFTVMDQRLAAVPFEFQSSGAYQLGPFLNSFDAIFTLNQDTFLERNYLNDNVSLMSGGRLDGYSLPGMRRRVNPNPSYDELKHPNIGVHEPSGDFQLHPRRQPYVKLHGSSNWRTGEERIIVLGGRKSGLIDRFVILKRYHDYFRHCLSSGPARLMIIGYGFGDDHINNAIMDAARGGQLELFIIDALGLDVIDKNKGIALYSPDIICSTLRPHVRGASNRSLREIFGSDHVEHGDVTDFVRR
jgi:hypothetical protein